MMDSLATKSSYQSIKSPQKLSISSIFPNPSKPQNNRLGISMIATQIKIIGKAIIILNIFISISGG